MTAPEEAQAPAQVPPHRGDRPRRHGRRLPGRRPRPVGLQQAGGHQEGPRPSLASGSRVPGHVPRRGPAGRAAQPPQRGADARDRAGGRPLLHRHGVPRRAAVEPASASAGPERELHSPTCRCASSRTPWLGGLHYAHELADYDGAPLNVVHRDVTPQNVFVTYDGSVKVVDFGIAKAVDSSSETRTGVVKGKVTYMAPEQARGERVDRRVDVYAVGVMLWEAIARRRMWKGTPDIAVVHELINGNIPSVRAAVPDAPDACSSRIVRRAPSRCHPRRSLRHRAGHARRPARVPRRGRRPHQRARRRQVHQREVRGGPRQGEGPHRVAAPRRAPGRARIPGSPRVDLPKIDPGQVMVTPTGAKVLEGGAPPTSVTELVRSSSLTNASTIVAAVEAAQRRQAAGRPTCHHCRGGDRRARRARRGRALPGAVDRCRPLPRRPAPTALPPRPVPVVATGGYAGRVTPPVAGAGRRSEAHRPRQPRGRARASSSTTRSSRPGLPSRARSCAATGRARCGPRPPHYVAEGGDGRRSTGDVMLELLAREGGRGCATPPGARADGSAVGRARAAAEPAAAAPAPAAARSPPRAGTAPRRPPPSQKPKRAIDSDSPYAQ